LDDRARGRRLNEGDEWTRRRAEPPPVRFVTKNATSEGDPAMNRNVTISLGALIVIIIIVALVF
jgi:hypothetical protein